MGAMDRAGGAIDEDGPLEFVQVRHEEMAAFMACAHAKFTGEVGVCLATSGPGEQFYESDPARGFARGFSIQTVSPLPIGWAEYVVADGHWGKALREYMRDYNHWSTLGALSELLPRAENRVTLANERDAHDMPIARFDYTQCDNDRASIAYAKGTLTRVMEAAGAQDILTIDRYAHVVGGCRMGKSPRDSVIDADQRVWGVPNLFVCDGSVMPTQGSANPALTIMALASRLGARLAAKRIAPAQQRVRA